MPRLFPVGAAMNVPMDCDATERALQPRHKTRNPQSESDPPGAVKCQTQEGSSRTDPDQVRELIGALPLKEKTLVLLAACTGLRMSELFGFKWGDVRFESGEINVIRSIVMQVVGPCKTEASQRPIPMDPHLAEALQTWRGQTQHQSENDWVFASVKARGRRPYWGQSLMRNSIRPNAVKLGISPRIGWHTFRHTYSTLLRATGADIKVMQELLRHASSRMTLDTYTQAVSDTKRKAQSEVVKVLVGLGQVAAICAHAGLARSV